MGRIYITKRPQDWDPSLIDEYDREADEYERENLADVEDFSILTKEAEMKLDDLIDEKREKREEMEEKDRPVDELTGVEDDIDLGDDDDW